MINFPAIFRIAEYLWAGYMSISSGNSGNITDKLINSTL